MSRVRLTIVLQVKEMSGIWSTEGIFPSLTTAIEHGRQNFIQNEWQVVGVTERRQDTLYTHEPLENIVAIATADVDRFEQVARDRERFARQREHEQQQEILANIARDRANRPFPEQSVEWADDDFEAIFSQRPKANWLVEGF